jgi:cell division protein FtsI (penicillin-binding protein 3)
VNILNRWNKRIASIVGAKGQSLETARARLSILSGVCLVLFAIVIIRVGDLTLLQKPREPKTDRAGLISENYIDRADIVDRNGVLLATSLQVPSLYADPTMIENKAYIARRLEEILNVEGIAAKLDKKGRFIWVKRGITPEQHYAINELGQPGLGFRNETRRFYPQGNLPSHVLGYANVDGKGLSGIELQYDDRLKKGGDALTLNMDIRVQHALVKSLSQTMGEFKAKAAIGGVIDVETGEIIAAVSLPDFDPHHVSKATNNQKFNRFATGVYEMGSTFKLFSTANFLEETGKPFSYQFDATKPLKEGRFTINDYHAKKRILSVPEVFIYSSNIGSALMGRGIGTTAMKNFYSDLGFMDRLDIDFPSRGKPLVPNPWRDVNTLTAAYGHGIAVTPLHVLRATAAIVNGGIAPQLSFVKNNDGTVQIQNRILSASTAHKMRQLLRLNVTNGSGEKADVAGYMVGGKTGTSEKASSTGGYDRDKLLSSFVGVFPSHAPRYAVLAIIDEPQGNKASFGYATGGWTGAPVVGSVIRDMASILAMSPVTDTPNLTAGLERYLQQESNITPARFER